MQAFLDGPGLSEDLDSLLALSGPQPDAAEAAASRNLSKVVLARRVAVRLRGSLDALALLALLQRADPSSYQVALTLPSGAAFVSSTPERLYMRHEHTVTAEAIAGAAPTACALHGAWRSAPAPHAPEPTPRVIPRPAQPRAASAAAAGPSRSHVQRQHAGVAQARGGAAARATSRRTSISACS